ncbi:major facilitator superfamily-domain-containing protein [Zychaea mexicana]|uniref:major facilitator superfamily-domain-containing protein n=1 Tax=Zychaea mexicana TaxID=64656 RepID=UPI0022FE9A5E|nr:major facilitator superfamily-domain-containing protein [Zychaea mexicana]KAI9493749.1 major facilitator superfamily-domain-containing protein [Zychaea mexicana]
MGESDDDVSSTSTRNSLLQQERPLKTYNTLDVPGKQLNTEPLQSSSRTTSGYTQEDHTNEIGKLSLNVLTMCLCIGAALPSLDISIVYTTMTQIGSEFQSAHLSNWIHSAYTLCTLVTMASAGGLSNVIGRKPVLVGLNVLFFIGSVGCAYARSFPQLVASRIIAGIGGGGIALFGNIILHDLVPSEKVGSYLSYLSTVQTLGFGLGAPIGGFITDYFGWRYCFRINILPLILILYVYIFHLNNYSIDESQKAELTTKEKLQKVDFGGIFLVSIGNVSFTCALLLGGSYGWASPQIISALIVAPIAYASFFLYERQWAKYPLLSRAAANDRNFTTSCVSVFLVGLCESGALVLIPQFLMGVLHFSTSDAGAWIMIEAMACPVGCFVAGRYMERTGRFARFTSVNILLYTLSMVMLYFWIGDRIPLSVGTFGIIVEGTTYGCFIVPMIVACTSTLPKESAATAMSMCLLARSVGYLTGAAAVSAIIQYTLKTLLPQRINGDDAEQLIEFIITSIRKVSTLAPEIQQIVSDIMIEATQRATLIVVAFAFLAFLASLQYQNINLLKKNDNTEETHG